MLVAHNEGMKREREKGQRIKWLGSVGAGSWGAAPGSWGVA